MSEWIKQEGAGRWMPDKEGEDLIGVVGEIEAGLYGNQLTIKKENGDDIKTPSHKVLQARLVHINVGDKIKIVYCGEEPPKIKGQKPTKLYEVYRRDE